MTAAPARRFDVGVDVGQAHLAQYAPDRFAVGAGASSGFGIARILA